MLFFGDCSSWRSPQNYVYAESPGGHPVLDLRISHSQTCAMVTLHRLLMAKEECDPSRSRRLMSHAHGLVSADHAGLRMRNDGADGWACIALILFVQRKLD